MNTVRIYRVAHPTPALPLTKSVFLQQQLQEVLDNSGLLLWEYSGMWGLVSREVIENALVPGCPSNITWPQTISIEAEAARLLLQDAEKPE